MQGKVARVDENEDGRESRSSKRSPRESDGLSNERLFPVADGVQPFAGHAEINDGLLHPVFAPSHGVCDEPARSRG
jgi:hypothetical protein